MNPKPLSGKRIWVTGASSGIGRACCIQIARAGGVVVAFGRDKERLDETLSQLDGEGHEGISIDLTNTNQLVYEIKLQLKTSIQPDGLVYAAGITMTWPLKYTTTEKLDNIMQVNVYPAFEIIRLITAKKAYNPMSLVLLSSVMASTGEVAKSAYSMSKGALLSGMRSMALELATKKIRVNCISPGVVNTPMTAEAGYRKSNDALDAITQKHPLGLGNPDDVAEPVVFLLSDAARWITGIDLKVDGGYSSH